MVNNIASDIFEPISQQYDFLNRFFSFYQDIQWRKILVYQTQKNLTRRTNLRLLDIGCGTGDVIESFLRNSGLNFSSLYGVDISLNMLAIFYKNIRYKNMKNCFALKADGTNLPFDNDSFDIVSAAFVIRNVENLDILFSEVSRVLKQNGIFSFLEFSMPQSPFVRKLFKNYLNLWVKKVGDFFSSSSSYSYLSESIVKFSKINVKDKLIKCNFKLIKVIKLSGGIVQLGVFKK